MSVKCLIDGSNHESVELLHKYIRGFKITQESYYTTYYPKKDLLTGELIPFKNIEQYLSSDFINKNNLKKWLKVNPDAGKQWAINWLAKRKEKKNLIYAPTQVELKSLTCPTIHYYNSIGGYDEICKSLGLKLRFNNKFKFKEIDPNVVLIQDSREQHPLMFECNGKFPRNIKIEKLDTGDYGLEPKYDKKIYIERKNLNDYVGTLTSRQKKDDSDAKLGLERFKAELDRAKKSDSYLIMLVESNINDALGFNYLPQMKWTRTNPNHIFKNARDLLNEYDNFQIMFVNGRKEATNILIKILSMGESAKSVDLQLMYENGGFE